jgi:hypothetical protein
MREILKKPSGTIEGFFLHGHGRQTEPVRNWASIRGKVLVKMWSIVKGRAWIWMDMA